jgi:co-chaperonin GroES (HSP10)
MIVDLVNYEPVGNQILLMLDVKSTTDSGIILDKKKADKWMLVAKVGPLVSSVVQGDYVIMGEPRGMAHLQFGNEAFMQVSEHDIIGYVKAKNIGKLQIESKLVKA